MILQNISEEIKLLGQDYKSKLTAYNSGISALHGYLSSYQCCATVRNGEKKPWGMKNCQVKKEGLIY